MAQHLPEHYDTPSISFCMMPMEGKGCGLIELTELGDRMAAWQRRPAGGDLQIRPPLCESSQAVAPAAAQAPAAGAILKRLVYSAFGWIELDWGELKGIDEDWNGLG
jgi:hypothetical protein